MASAEMKRMGTKKTLKDISKILNKTNKLIGMLDPSYATRALVRKVTAPIRKVINSKISEVLAKAGKITGVTAKTARKALMHSVLPLNHTVAP
jgi:UDP-N-acetylmuramyl pentapeptide synthase